MSPRSLAVHSQGLTGAQDGSYADVVVKLGLIKLLSKRFDVCEEASVYFS